MKIFENKKTTEMALINILINNEESYNTVSDKIDINMFNYDESKKLIKAIIKSKAFNQSFNYSIFNELSEEYKREYESTSILLNNVDKYNTLNRIINIFVEEFNKSKLLKEFEILTGKIKNNDNILLDNVTNLIYNFNEKIIEDTNFDSNFYQELMEIYDGKKIDVYDFPFNSSMNDTFEGGLKRKEVMYIGGIGGMFKTSFLINIAVEQLKNKKNCVIFSMEMPSLQIKTNIFSILLNKDFKETIKYKDLTNEDKELMKSIEEYLTIIDISGLTIFAIEKYIKQIKLSKKVDIVLLDYLTLLSWGKLDERNGIAEATKNIKRIAKENDIAFIALAQLNRDMKNRKDKRAVCSDLLGSSTILSDADFVYMLHREQYYYNEVGKNDLCPAVFQNKLEGWFGKSRRGQQSKQYYNINAKTKKIINELSKEELALYKTTLEEFPDVSHAKEINEDLVYSWKGVENKSNKTIDFLK